MQVNPFTTADTTINMNAELVRLNIGEFRCTILRDMLFKYLAKDFFINANQDEVNAALIKHNGTPDNIPSPFIALLLQKGDKKILVDTGIGFSDKPIVFRGASHQFKGRLQQLLLQENIKKEDITDVVLTHLHPDHIGGIHSEHEQVSFPNARFHIHEDEWNYWHSAQSANQPGMFHFFIERNITALKSKDLHLVKGDFVELLPGITALKADGHTPGQIALNIHSGKEHLLYISDAFLHPLHIERLDWQTNYDLDHGKAKQSRIKLLELAYKDNMLVNAFHFDFPGLGRINKRRSKWMWNSVEK
jgi:glyoxylase-like metal-dependent hydrolase (beta-lactamase superfamily II)